MKKVLGFLLAFAAVFSCETNELQNLDESALHSFLSKDENYKEI